VPILALVLVATVAGLLAWRGTTAMLRTWWGRAPGSAVAAEVRELGRGARLARNRLDAEIVTGLALTLALATTALAGIVVGLLALAVRRSDALVRVDSYAARWAHAHGTEATHRVLQEITNLGSTQVVVAIAVVVGAVEWARVPSRWIPVYLAVVTAGDSLVTNLVKAGVDRARPAIDPAALALGPSFPSGHSSTAAAFFAALALLIGRRRSNAHKAALAGVAAGLAVAVAASRVLLDVHWLSDVVGGLALGWGWFALCTAAFGGWLIRFGAPVEAAAQPRAPGRSRPGQPVRSGTRARGPSTRTHSCSARSESDGSPSSAR
jgi:membrane-associated phospholipid phosphatase